MRTDLPIARCVLPTDRGRVDIPAALIAWTLLWIRPPKHRNEQRMLDSAPWLYRASWAPEPIHVAAARRFVDGHLRDHGLGSAADVVLLVVSELATNAVLHTRGPFSVSLGMREQVLTLSVRDGSLVAPGKQTVHGLMDPRGRGLLIVDRLSTAWGVSPESDGKSVWACFELPKDGAPMG
jgi:anti-sigma regulatory factor (Ser/Thr protein kinase)